MGRYRNLSKHLESDSSERKQASKREHGLRAAINTPIQGGAADIVIAAMIKLHRDPILRSLGYKLLLQIHDEVILVIITFLIEIGRSRYQCWRSTEKDCDYNGEPSGLIAKSEVGGGCKGG